MAMRIPIPICQWIRSPPSTLGCERGNNLTNMITRMENPASKRIFFICLIPSGWWRKNSQKCYRRSHRYDFLVYQEKFTRIDFIFMSLYNIFSEFLEDIFRRRTAKTKLPVFKDSVIWNKLFNFQKDAALAIINKLEQYNGCILADSVGLGKKNVYSSCRHKNITRRNKKMFSCFCPKKALWELDDLPWQSD